MTVLLMILTLVVGAIVIGVILFFPMRWLFTRNNPDAERSPEVTPRGLLEVVIVVTALMFVAWHMEAGNKLPSIIWGVVGITGSIYLFIIQRKRDDD